MTHIEYFLKGFLRIKVTGENTERFLNLCGNHGIMVWSLERDGDVYFLSIPLEKRSEIDPLLTKTNTEAVLLSEHGLPFLLHRCRCHIPFLAGMLLCFLLWGISGQCLWNVDFEGNSYITRNQLERYLLQKNIEIPMLLHHIDTEKLGEQIRQDFPVVTWVSVSLRGTTMLIHIKENEMKDYKKDEERKDRYQDLTASEDGIIVSMITRSGTPLKSVGDQVERGEILVKGSYPVYEEDGTVKKENYCMADADVVVASAEKHIFYVDIYDQEKAYTGKEASFKWLMVGENEISPIGFLNPERPQEIIKVYESGSMLLKQKFPVQFGTYLVRPYETVRKKNSDLEMQRKTDKMIMDLVKRIEQKGVQIRQKNVTIKKNDKKWVVSADLLLWNEQKTMVDTKMADMYTEDPIK